MHFLRLIQLIVLSFIFTQIPFNYQFNQSKQETSILQQFYRIFQKMDLAYPSQKQVQRQPNPISTINKKMKSTIWSIKQIPLSDQNFSTHIRQEFIQLIQNDKVIELINKMSKCKINLESELGSRGSKWSFLHFCCRWDSIKVLEYLLKYQYKTSPTDYSCLVNSKTLEGLTPLMIAIINDSKNCLKLLLQYGGLDIFLVDSNKLTSYQIALSNKNELAIKLLIQYEHQHKLSDYINTQKLQQQFKKPDDDDCSCIKIFTYLFQWMFREQKNKDILNEYMWQPKSSERRSIQIQNVTYIDKEFLPQASSICEDIQQLKLYEIEWLRPQQIFYQKQIKLFDNYNPFSIRQLNFSLKHNLIIFQSLARSPWILRKKIFKNLEVEGMYNVELFPNRICKRITIDDYLPCFRDKKEPMFLYSDRQLWPMLLQKSWVKCYNNYVNCRNIQADRILEELTGFHAETFKIAEFEEGMLFNNLKKLHKNNRIIILTSKQDSQLRQQNQGSESFSILNFYEKQSKKLYLVNCPFRLPQWKSKQKDQFLALRLIKAHFNTHNQMSVWLDYKNLKDYFSTFTVCYTDQKLVRSELKSKSKATYFFKFDIQPGAKFQLNFKMYQTDINESQVISLDDLQICRNQRISLLQFNDHLQSFNKIKSIIAREGQYFCKVTLPNPTKLKNIVLVAQAPVKLNFEYIEQEIGIIEWLCLLRDKIVNQRMRQVNEYIQSRQIILQNYLLIVVKQKIDWQGKSYMRIQKSKWIQTIHGYVQGEDKLIGEVIQGKCWYLIIQIQQGETLDSLDLKYVCD